MLRSLLRARTDNPQLNALGKVALFAHFSRAELRTVLGRIHHRSYLKDEIIFDENEEGQAVYFVLSGSVLICHQGRPEDGLIATPGEGECFGELALLDNAPRIAQVWAAEDCELAVLFREDFLSLLNTHAEVGAKLSLALAEMHAGPAPARQRQPLRGAASMRPNTLHPGPVTWASIIGITCLLLYVFQQILWLVIPFLLALALYYVLAPLANRLVMAGTSIELAASLLGGAFLLCGAISVMLFYPLAIANAEAWQALLLRYLNGGAAALDGIIVSLGSQFSVLRQAEMTGDLRRSLVDVAAHFSDRHLGNAIMGFAAWLPSLLLAPVITYFMLKDGARLRKYLGSAVPNAYFEKTLYLMHALDRTARLYFIGLIKLVLIDATLLSTGLWALGVPYALLLGSLAALLGVIPYLGPLLGCALAVMVGATDYPGNYTLIYWILGLFATVRLLDDFIFLPYIVGKNLRIHPLLTLLMFFIGEAIAGITGLMLVIPVLGVVMVIGETLEVVLRDVRLHARHAHARRLAALHATQDLHQRQ